MNNDKQMEIRRDVDKNENRIDDHELRIDELEYDVKDLKEEMKDLYIWTMSSLRKIKSGESIEDFVFNEQRR